MLFLSAVPEEKLRGVDQASKRCFSSEHRYPKRYKLLILSIFARKNAGVQELPGKEQSPQKLTRRICLRCNDLEADRCLVLGQDFDAIDPQYFMLIGEVWNCGRRQIGQE